MKESKKVRVELDCEIRSDKKQEERGRGETQ